MKSQIWQNLGKILSFYQDLGKVIKIIIIIIIIIMKTDFIFTTSQNTK